jgi:SAM-dependent methyltransferase
VAGYDEDLAYTHDVGFGAVARAGAAELVTLLRGHGRTSGLVVELGCGSGISSRLLVDAGYDVLGIDSSPAMIELARARVPEATFRVGSFVDAELPRSAAVTAFGEVLNYVFDERSSERELRRLFDRVHAALEPGGLLVCDLVGEGRRSTRIWSAGADWAVLVEADEDRRRRMLTRRITTFREVDGAYRRSEEVHRQRLYPAATIAALLRRTGFRVRIRRSYGPLELRPEVRAFVARRAGGRDRA